MAAIQKANATVYYWDPEATATESASSMTGTWTTSAAQWSTASAQTASPTAWVSGYAADFSAGSATVTSAFTVTVNSTITIGGIFNGGLSTAGTFVTVSGTGSFSLASGPDAFCTSGSDGGTTTITIPMSGPGQIALEGADKIYLNAANTFTGGTSIGYVGLTAFTGTCYFNNGAAFGTGPFAMSTSGTGSTLQLNTSAAATVPNAWLASNINLNITANPAGLTFSGAWSMYGTPALSINGTGNLVTLSGPMSGVGGLVKYGPGILVLSGANSFTGLTIISNGVLSATADNNFGTAPSTANYDITLSGGTLNSSNTFTLNPKRLILLTAGSSIGVSTGKTLTYGGVMTGTGGFTKTGAGTLSLTAASGYTGTTTVSTGTLEADSTGGSTTGTNSVTVQSGGTLSGIGLVSGPVLGTGTISPGTTAGPGKLTLGSGLNLSSGGTYSWNLTNKSTTNGYSTISVIGGDFVLGGASKLALNFSGGASAPSITNAFWLTQEAWTIIYSSGTAGDPSGSQFASILNGSFSAGNFTNYVNGNAQIILLFMPNFAVFESLSDAGPNFFSGENLECTNFSGLSLYAWSSTDPTVPVGNWTMVGRFEENPLPQTPGYSQYVINVNPTTSPEFYIAGNTNVGPYLTSPVPMAIVTTPDYQNFTVISTNVSISPNGVLGLRPPPAIILPGLSYSVGQFQFQFTAPTNQSYVVESSLDLINWTNIGSGVVTASPETFTDTNAGNFTNQYYEVLLPSEY